MPPTLSFVIYIIDINLHFTCRISKWSPNSGCLPTVLHALLSYSVPLTRSACLNIQNKIPQFWIFFFDPREIYWGIKCHWLNFVVCSDSRIHIEPYETFHKVRTGQGWEKLFPGNELPVSFFVCVEAWRSKRVWGYSGLCC